MTGSTPGPWELRLIHMHSASPNGAHIISSVDGTLVARITAAADKPLDQKQADAYLIAAAPDLLTALTHAREELEDYHTSQYGEDYNSPMINAAIAKAEPSTGETADASTAL